MDPITREIVVWSDRILSQLLEHKQQNPKFTFWLRRKNQERFNQGQWFQGSNYIFVAPFKKNAPDNRTKTIGFVVSIQETTKAPYCYFEIVYKSEKNQELLSFYDELVDSFPNLRKVSDQHYVEEFIGDNVHNLLTDFLNNHYRVISELIVERKQEQVFIIGEDDFQRSLQKIETIRQEIQPIVMKTNHLVHLKTQLKMKVMKKAKLNRLLEYQWHQRLIFGIRLTLH